MVSALHDSKAHVNVVSFEGAGGVVLGIESAMRVFVKSVVEPMVIDVVDGGGEKGDEKFLGGEISFCSRRADEGESESENKDENKDGRRGEERVSDEKTRKGEKNNALTAKAQPCTAQRKTRGANCGRDNRDN